MGVLAINFIVYYLINNIMEKEMKLREHAVFREKVKSETAMYHSISENIVIKEITNKTHHSFAVSASGAFFPIIFLIYKIMLNSIALLITETILRVNKSDKSKSFPVTSGKKLPIITIVAYSTIKSTP